MPKNEYVSRGVTTAAPWNLDFAAVCSALEQCGVAVLDSITTVENAAALLAYCQSQAAWRAAGIGAGHSTNLAIRGDRTHWLSSENGAIEADVLAMLDRLRCALNQTLWLNLASVEAHFAHYAPGTGYARHKDVFQHDAQRVISFVLYLNPAWQPADGGRLALYLPEGVQFVLPTSQSAVLFVSADIEHAVERTNRDRYSIAAWFRRAE